jgi:FixJ family two-component response regulator
MSNTNFTVYLIDDDIKVLKALTRLLRTTGYEPQAFASPEDFLKAHDPSTPGCAIVDVAMPELDGLALQKTLIENAPERPIIFLSGRSDIPISVRAMQAGAVDFLVKPVAKASLLKALARAAAQDQVARAARETRDQIITRLRTLTPREFEVLTHVIAGRLNKQIAADLGTVEKTVKVHRSRMMEKIGVKTVAELVRLTESIKLGPYREKSARCNSGQLSVCT